MQPTVFEGQIMASEGQSLLRQAACVFLPWQKEERCQEIRREIFRKDVNQPILFGLLTSLLNNNTPVCSHSLKAALTHKAE